MGLNGYETDGMQLPIIAIAAGTDVTNQPLMKTSRKIRFTGAKIGTQETVTQNATSYVSMSINVGTTTIARWSTITSGEGSLTGGQFATMDIVEGNEDVASATNIVFKATHASSGTAVATPVVQLEYDIVD